MSDYNPDTFVHPTNEQYIEKLKALNYNLFGRHHLRTWDHSYDDIEAIVVMADFIQSLYEQERTDAIKLFKGGSAVYEFRDASTRTKSAFATSMALVGLGLYEYDSKKSQAAHGESLIETVNCLSFLCRVYGIRDDIYLGSGETYMEEVISALEYGFSNKFANRSILDKKPIFINLQSDVDHYTQALSDLMHCVHHFGSLENLRGKKFCMSWGYSASYGKPLSVPQGIIGLLTRYGVDMHLAIPSEDFLLLDNVIEVAEKQTKESDGKFTITYDMDSALVDADIVYVKSWVAQDLARARGEEYRAGTANLEELEKIAIERNNNHTDWTLTEERWALAKPGAIGMHCLPADVEYKGEVGKDSANCKKGEWEAPVFAAQRVGMYSEAKNKPFVMAACSLLSAFEQVPEKIEANLAK
ncbi:hypothetical protein PCE1_000452 [Barthelona sp. PCE]